MALPRRPNTSKYGDFKHLMESRDEHGGYGDLTWHVGPHAGENPYGKSKRIGWVNRAQLLSMAGGKHAPDELERHAQAASQVMGRGDVTHVPQVRFEGGKAMMDPEHQGALMAAGKHGAEKVPIAYHKDDFGALQLGAEFPGKQDSAKRDPKFKWRWNGKGYYTKPSFNQGKCPPGLEPDAGQDVCAGASPKKPTPGEKREIPSDMPPAEMWGSGSRPSILGGRRQDVDRGRQRPQRAPRRGGNPFARGARRARPARARAEPDGPPREVGPMPAPVSMGDIQKHSRFQPGQGGGLDRRIFNDRYAVQASMKKSGQLAIEAMKQIAPNLAIGRELGCGLSGCAYAANPAADGSPTVVKMDKGDNEALMARLLIKDPELGGLSSSPKYISVHDTGVKDKHTGMKVHAIHREDLDDVPHGRVKDFFGSFGSNFLHYFSSEAKDHSPEDLVREYDRGTKSYMKRAQESRDPEVLKQFQRVHEDIRKMVKKGVVPCDLHSENWGMRKSTGEVVMRDVGCAGFAGGL